TSVPHWFVEIRDVRGQRLVTDIEFMSPTNKRGRGRKEYLARRRRILRSEVHLLEIDLLRRGRRVPTQESLPDAPYFVFLNRVEKQPIMDVWPIALRSTLPPVPVPLSEGHPDVLMDLQLALGTIYDALHYELIVNYRQPPEVPLTSEDAGWADERLR